MVNIESSLESLGLNYSEFPSNDKPVNLYSNFGSAPIAKLFLTDKGYTLRFGSDNPTVNQTSNSSFSP